MALWGVLRTRLKTGGHGVVSQQTAGADWGQVAGSQQTGGGLVELSLVGLANLVSFAFVGPAEFN